MNCWAASFVGKVIRPFPTTPPSRSSATAYWPPIEGQVVQPIRFFTSRPFTIDRKIQYPDSPPRCRNGPSPRSGIVSKNRPQLRGWLEAEAEAPDRSRLRTAQGLNMRQEQRSSYRAVGLPPIFRVSEFPEMTVRRAASPHRLPRKGVPSPGPSSGALHTVRDHAFNF